MRLGGSGTSGTQDKMQQAAGMIQRNRKQKSRFGPMSPLIATDSAVGPGHVKYFISVFEGGVYLQIQERRTVEHPVLSLSRTYTNTEQADNHKTDTQTRRCAARLGNMLSLMDGTFVYVSIRAEIRRRTGRSWNFLL